MTKRGKPQEATQDVVTEVSRLDMLEGFVELVSERYGYWMARRLTQSEMSEKCKTELTAVREKNKDLNKHIAEYIENATPELKDSILKEQKELKDLGEVASKATKPFRDKISPLAQAQRYCDTVTIPDSLKELGKPIVPRFSLSEWVSKALEATKNKKRRK